MIRRYFFALAVLFPLLLSGCKAVTSMLPFGDNDDDDPKASKIAITLSTSEFVNLNLSGEPAPIEVQIVFLSEDSKLDSLYYDEIAEGELAKALGKSYVDHQDYHLTPNQLKLLPKSKVKSDVHYVAVIAHFSAADESEWYKIEPIEETGKNYNFLIRIDENSINIQKDKK